MALKCPKCGSENTKESVTGRGCKTLRCLDCKFWGNYGKQKDQQGSEASKVEADSAKENAPTKAGRKSAGTDQRSGGTRREKTAGK